MRTRQIPICGLCIFRTNETNYSEDSKKFLDYRTVKKLFLKLENKRINVFFFNPLTPSVSYLMQEFLRALRNLMYTTTHTPKKGFTWLIARS